MTPLFIKFVASIKRNRVKCWEILLEIPKNSWRQTSLNRKSYQFHGKSPFQSVEKFILKQYPQEKQGNHFSCYRKAQQENWNKNNERTDAMFIAGEMQAIVLKFTGCLSSSIDLQFGKYLFWMMTTSADKWIVLLLSIWLELLCCFLFIYENIKSNQILWACLGDACHPTCYI